MRCVRATPSSARRGPVPRRKQGAIAVMFAASLMVIFGFFGLALDLSMLFNRKVEMQNAANTVALAAALELNGTSAGVSMALRKAAERFVTLPGTVVGGMSYQYSTRTMQWSDSAIAFGATPAGPWVGANTALAQPARMLFVRVSTNGLDPAYGEVQTLFIRVLKPDMTTATVSGQAIAGRSAIKVTPLGICAMRPEAGRRYGTELEEYGFRRGVSYDLMQLNPNSTTEGATFLINPFSAPGSTGAAAAAGLNAVKPFVCMGTMAMSRVTGGDLVVSSPFPLGDLFQQLNSRFDVYTAPCTATTAPPDANIQPYAFNDSVPWMETPPTVQAASLWTEGGKRWTVAGPEPAPDSTTAGMYGPLWSYAKAAKFTSYVPGSAEPVGGYGTFNASEWATLYNPGKPKAKSYGSATPYSATTGPNFKKPTNTGLRGRRVLNVALLSCTGSSSGSRATVLAVGKFFMTVPATSTNLYGEFAGIEPEQSLGSLVKLYP